MKRVIKVKAGKKGNNMQMSFEVKLEFQDLMLNEVKAKIERVKDDIYLFLSNTYHHSEISIK